MLGRKHRWYKLNDSVKSKFGVLQKDGSIVKMQAICLR